MTTSILCRVEVNPLTTPHSHLLKHVPRATFGNEEVAARIAQRNPVYNQGLGKGFLEELAEDMLDALVNGNQVKIAGAFTCHISFTGRLDAPDAPLPPVEDCLHVKFYPSRRLVDALRKDAQLERLPMSEKLPVITSVQDTVLKLDNVLNSQGLLRVTGVDLGFDPEDGVGKCVLEGTRNGRTVQTRFGTITDTEVIVIPDIPSQTDSWNNEYQLSISTHYTDNGTVRTGTYRRMLRTPLAVVLGTETGILSNGGATALVTVTGGTLTAASTRVRIQVLLDTQDNDLRFSLLDMKDGGAAGNEVRVAANGTYTLSGYADSALTTLEVQVNKYNALAGMVRSPYSGRLVDILDVSAGS
jgi:hypothetical protein